MSETSEPFRDPKAGALARRQALLGKRRDELVTMPHAVRRVVVARWGRIAGAMAAWLGAEVFVIAAVSPAFSRWVTGLLPGREPAPLSTLLVGAWILGIVAYWIARSTAEHRFAVTMSRTVLPGNDLFEDIERLDHVHPDDVARGMAHGLEVLSAALPVAAAATLVPATAVYFAMLVHGGHWPSERMFEDWLVAHGSSLALIALCGVGASMAMSRRMLRESGAAPIAASVGVVAAITAVAYWWLVGAAAVALAIAVVGLRLRKERALIQAEDPAAGSDVFTIRGMIRQLREVASGVARVGRAHRRGLTIAFVSLPILVIGWRATRTHHIERKLAQVEVSPFDIDPQPAQAGTHYQSQAEPAQYQLVRVPCIAQLAGHGGCMQLTVELRDHQAITVPPLPGMKALAPGWTARLHMHYMTGTARGLTAIAFPTSDSEYDQHPRWLDDYNPDASSEVTACGNTLPLGGLRILPDAGGPAVQHVTLMIQPTLELADTCP